MKYFIFFTLYTLLTITNVLAETSQEQTHLENLFSLSEQEKQNIDNSVTISSLEAIGFYPVIKIDFFNSYNSEKYRNSLFTTTFKNISFKKDTVLGIRLRFTVDYLNR